MKNHIIRGISFSILMLFCFSALISNTNPRDSISTYNPIDSISSENSKAWPDCPKAIDIKILRINDSEYMALWEGVPSQQVEYEIQRDSRSKKSNQSTYVNGSSYYFALDEGEDYFNLKIRTLCYDESTGDVFNSDWQEIKMEIFNPKIIDFCQDYTFFIKKDDNEVYLHNTPDNVILFVDVCQGNSCQTVTNSAQNANEEELRTLLNPLRGYRYENIRIVTKKGETSCGLNSVITNPLDNKSMLVPSCSDFNYISYSTEPPNGGGIGTGTTECHVVFYSDFTFTGTATYEINGVTTVQLFNFWNPEVLVPYGTSLDLDFRLEYRDSNNITQFVYCTDRLDVTCEELLEEDQCDLVNIYESAECRFTFAYDQDLILIMDEVRTTDALEMVSTIIPASCGLENGQVQLFVSGGSQPYQFLWSDGSDDQFLYNKPGGLYSVTITDASGCQVEEEFEILQDQEKELLGDIASPLCDNDNGSISIEFLNGCEPITYVWSNGDNGNLIDGLAPGVYTVTATDISGTQFIETFQLENTNSFNFNADGGDEGLSEGRFLPGGTVIYWKFDPVEVADQLIVTSSIDGVLLDSGKATRKSDCNCNGSSCDCSDVYMGDHAGQTIDLANYGGLGIATISAGLGDCGSAFDFANEMEGSFIIPNSGDITVTVIGNSCGGEGTAWTVNFGCAPLNKNLNTVLEEYDLMCRQAYKYEMKMMQENVNINELTHDDSQIQSNKLVGLKANGIRNQSAYLNCPGGLVEYRLIDPVTGKISYCKVELECGDPVDVDDPIDPNDPDGLEPDLCAAFNYELDETGFLPNYMLRWDARSLSGLTAVVRINNTDFFISDLLYKETIVQPGDQIEIIVELTDGTYTQDCTFNILAPELVPEEVVDLSVLCDYFSLLEGLLNNDQSFNLSIANGDESVIQDRLDAMNITMGTLEEYLSQIESIEFEYTFTNDEYPNNQQLSIMMYENPYSGQYGGPESLYFNPVGWSDLVQGISTNQLTGSYRIYLTDIYGNEIICNKVQLTIGELPDDEQEDNDFVQLNCGDVVDMDADESLPSAETIEGNVITIYGFPILVTEANGGGSPFTGQGIIALPFNQSEMYVEFTNLTVNTDFEVTEGAIGFPRDTPYNHEDFYIDQVLEVGGNICVPPDPPAPGGPGDNGGPYDDWGFDENGIHKDTGTDVDKDGYTQDGTYKGNGTPYNDDGCDRRGFQEDGMTPCDPGGDDDILDEFLDDNGTQIDSDISDLVKDLVQEKEQEKAALQCEEIRIIMQQTMDRLGYAEEQIYGQGNIYFNPGMSKKFSSEPERLVTDIDGRNEDTKLLEDKHVELYHCDKENEELTEQIDKIKVICEDPDNNEVYDHIKSLIENWGAWEKDTYINDADAFAEWLSKEVEEYIESQTGGDDGIGFENIKVIPDLESIFSFDAIDYSSTVSTQQINFSKDELFEVSQAYLRGDQFIRNIPRAFYVERMFELNEEKAAMGMAVSPLPIKIESGVGSFVYTIYIDNIQIGIINGVPTTYLDAFFIMEHPESGKRFSFSALGIGFEPGGLTGDARLMLDTEVHLKLSNSVKMILKANGNTYVDWSCNGFESMGIDIDLEFCRNIIVPLDANRVPLPEEERYRLSLTKVITEWLEFTIELNSPGPFSMAKYEDIAFDFEDIKVDMSSTAGGGITPLSGYEHDDLEDGTLTDRWKGFYIGSLDVFLPNTFSSNPAAELRVTAKDIIIDGSGVTGETELETNPNILRKEDGNLSGWQFGIDAFSMRVINNHVAGGSIAGDVRVPIMEEFMRYKAEIYPGNYYAFTVTPLEDATVNMFMATATINKESSINVSYDGTDFLASANLSGTLKIDGVDEIGNLNIKAPDLSFSGLTIQNHSPYFKGGAWDIIGSESNTNMGSFPIKINKVGSYDTDVDTEGAIGFDLGITLSDDIDGLSMEGKMGVVGNITFDDEGKQNWVFNRLEPKQFCLNNATFPGVEKLSACLEWYKNEGIYGNGFRGSASIAFKGLPAEISAVAQFGESDTNFKYFFVDALAELGEGIPAGPLTLNGFGGGISHHMDNVFDHTAVNYSDPSGTLNEIGSSFSGTQYTPNQSTGLAFKASALFSLAGREEIFNGSVELGMSFNSETSEHSGVKEIYFKGLGQFLSPPLMVNEPAFLQDIPDKFRDGKDQYPSTFNAALSGFAYFNYNFNEPSFKGDIGVFLKAGPLTGAGSNDKLVNADIYFGPSDWHIYFGEPEKSKRCGMELNLGSLFGVQLDGYFVSGTNIPSIPDVPENVSKIAYKYKPFQGLSGAGPGVAFGASLTVEVEAGIGGVIEGYLMASAGFDVMIKKFSDVTCDDEVIGINGWYGAGQAYAHVAGGVKFLGVDVFKAGIATILQARLPNPSVFTGTVGVQFKFLFFKVKKSIRINIGDNCVFQSSNPAAELGMDVIAYFDPADKAEEILPDHVPVANTNVPIHEVIEMQSLANEPITYEITFKKSYAKITTSDGTNIPCEPKLRDNGREIEILPFRMLPSNEEITVEMKVDIYKNNKYVISETKTTTFTVAEGYKDIPKSNIVASYPANGMYNYYKNDQVNCFIDLEQGQPDLFYEIPDEMIQEFELQSASGTKVSIPYTYDPYVNRINFTLDPSILVNGEMYKLTLIRKQPSRNTSINEQFNVSESRFRTQKLCELFFRVSEYDTFNQKFNIVKELSQQSELKEIEDLRGDDATIIYIDIEGIEPFTQHDIIEFTYADANINNWYKHNLEDDIFTYDAIQFAACDYGAELDFNSEDFVNQAASIENIDLSISREDFISGVIPAYTESQRLNFNYAYNLGLAAGLIYQGVKNCEHTVSLDCLDYAWGNDMDGYELCIEQSIEDVYGAIYFTYKDIDLEKYSVDVNYKLPDGTSEASNKIIFIK